MDIGLNRLILLPLLALLAGCLPSSKKPYFELIDQRTFSPPQPPSAADLARAALPPLPLVVVRYDQADFDYGPTLATAVEAAQALKPDVAFDVLGAVPLNATPAVQAEATSQGQLDVEDVAASLAALGVAQDHIHVGLRGDTGTPPREVRIYAR